mgnify:CR=1 FL=1
MTRTEYSIGTALRLVKGTSLWGEAYILGAADTIFIVAALVDDGTARRRVTLRDQNTGEIAFLGVDPSLFERIHYSDK